MVRRIVSGISVVPSAGSRFRGPQRRTTPLWFAALMMAGIAIPSSSPKGSEPLSFVDRVNAQTAIEKVYYEHRIWPKENPQPKPSFEQMVPKALIEAKVTDYLKKSAALEKFWQRPITAEQLQAEMDRMAKGTRSPATLKELFAALNNDPYLIAECLARPILAERRIRQLYQQDVPGNDGESATPPVQAVRAHESGVQAPDTKPFPLWWGREKPGLAPEIPSGQQNCAMDLAPIDYSPTDSTCNGTWMESSLRNVIDPRSNHCAVWTGTEMIVWGGSNKTGGRYNLTTDSWSGMSTGPNCPSARSAHAAVWTGTRMIIWGGSNTGIYTNTGGIYDPVSDTWSETSTQGDCPSPRSYSTAVWSGTEMIVWGGSDSTYLNTGGRYNPSSDTWARTSTDVNCPSGRILHTAVWTGFKMIIWGGGSDSGYKNSGGVYDPVLDSWSQTAIDSNCPNARSKHVAVWADTRMIVWGGENATAYTGGRYDPNSNSWTATSTLGSPASRPNAAAVWTGTEMIVWGGGSGISFLNTGGRYNPAGNYWTATPTTGGCPSGRYGHTAVWTETEMIVWGGFVDGNGNATNTGARFNASNGTWTATSTGVIAPERRYGHSAVWTGAEMIIWGGSRYGWFNSGGCYDPATDTWRLTPTSAPAPSARGEHTAVWTGVEMIIWGGTNSVTFFNDGARYNPVSNAWTATMQGTNCPAARSAHCAVWTGTQMVIWGGRSGNTYYNTGGKYTPFPEAWVQTSTTSPCPAGRGWTSAVWTGSELIVWGGYSYTTQSNYYNSGGRYNPAADSWTATSVAGDCPSGRYHHASVWSGSQMLVWGGGNDTLLFNSGSRYSPADNSWTAMSVLGDCPSARQYASGVWTGSSAIFWGGINSIPLNSGGIYDPGSDTWTAMPLQDFTPSDRTQHTAVWTGSEMIVWGGNYLTATGGIYVPGPQPSGIPDLTLEDTDPCLNGIMVSWPPDPGSWADSGTGTRLYAVWRDGVQLESGGCGGQLPYGTSQCTDSTTVCGSTYRYRIQFVNGCGASALTRESAILDTGPVPPYVLGSTDGCQGSTLTLATGSYASYQWIKDGVDMAGETNQSVDVAVGGNYSVRISDGNGCGATSPARLVTFHAPPSPTVTGSSSGCANPGVPLGTQSFAAYQWLLDGTAISGATSQFYSAHVSGSYSVRATDSYGCQAVSTAKALTIYANPTPAISGASSGCANPGVTLSVGAYSSYQWYRNGFSISGATAQTYVAAVTANYSVTVTNSQGCTGISPGLAVTIYSNPVPTVSGSNSGCADAPVTLSTGSFSGYQWQRNGIDISGATSQSYLADASGTYTVRVTDGNGCVGTSSGKSVTIYPLPSPSIAGPDNGCSGTPITLSTGAFSSYQWRKDDADITGATGQNLVVSVGGDYSVRVTDSHGCSATSTAKAVVFHDLPSPTVVGQAKNACGTMSASLSTQAYSSYQWYKDGSPLTGENGQSLSVSATGSYAVNATDANGCSAMSPSWAVVIQDCTDEVSPASATVPVRLVPDTESGTGYYLYIEKIPYATGYSVYQGTIASLAEGVYDHSSLVACDISLWDLGTGELRAEITPGEGDRYLLVTAHTVTVEGPSGYNSLGQEIPPEQSTCAP